MAEERGPEGREGQTGREGAKGREGIPGIAGATGPEGPKGNTGASISRPIKAAFVIITLIFFLTLAGFAWIVQDVSDNSSQLTLLVSENQKRIADIQQVNHDRIQDIQEARIESCEKTYAGIKEVFRPFFPPPPRTPEQQRDLDTFNETIRVLQSGCKQQTGQG